MQTYWLHTKKADKSMADESAGDDSIHMDDWLELPTELFDSQRSKMGLGNYEIRQCLSEQNQRLADWNSNQLILLLDNVVARRKTLRAGSESDESKEEEADDCFLGNAHIGAGDSGSILKEATDRIVMPDYDAQVVIDVERTPTHITDVVHQQLHDYVAIICSMYVDNPFHSYQHASHVTMQCIRLLSSIAAPKDHNFSKGVSRDKARRERFHSQTYGISSDPITHFALAFAALIHDVGTYHLSQCETVFAPGPTHTTRYLGFLRPPRSFKQHPGQGTRPSGSHIQQQMCCRAKQFSMWLGPFDGS